MSEMGSRIHKKRARVRQAQSKQQQERLARAVAACLGLSRAVLQRRSACAACLGLSQLVLQRRSSYGLVPARCAFGTAAGRGAATAAQRPARPTLVHVAYLWCLLQAGAAVFCFN
jgi:hypothetical protein